MVANLNKTYFFVFKYGDTFFTNNIYIWRFILC